MQSCTARGSISHLTFGGVGLWLLIGGAITCPSLELGAGIGNLAGNVAKFTMRVLKNLFF